MTPRPSEQRPPAPWQARWHQLTTREQALVLTATALVALALLWSLALAPALRTLGQSSARHQQLDAQLQHMHTLQAQAQQLQAAPSLRLEAAQRSLQNTLAQHLGASAQVQLSGTQAHITLRQARADTLAAWLAQVRSNAHANVQEARLSRAPAAQATATPTATPSGSSGGPLWSGTLLLTLPDTAPER